MIITQKGGILEMEMEMEMEMEKKYKEYVISEQQLEALKSIKDEFKSFTEKCCNLMNELDDIDFDIDVDIDLVNFTDDLESAHDDDYADIVRMMCLDEGKKFDNGKLRTDLLPVRPLLDIANVLTHGAEKYGERNWEHGMDWGRAYGAALRHLFAWQSGETYDPETKLNHLSHAACELLFLLEYSHSGAGTDNRPL